MTTETLKGQVHDVRVFGGGWGILSVLHGSKDELAKVTGHPLGVQTGDTVECTGAWGNHPKHGRQFQAREIRVVVPTDAAGAIAWMLSKLPNIGRRLATELAERWPPPEIWEVLEQRPDELVEVRGITHERARLIHAAYLEALPDRDELVELKGYGLTDRQIAALQEVFEDGTLEAIRRDPYVLITRVDGFGWKRADDLAMKMGLPANHPSRIRAFLLYAMREASGAGHVYVPAGKLVGKAGRELGVQAHEVRREANALLEDEQLVVRDGRAYLRWLHVAESTVAADLARMLRRTEEAA